MTSWQGAALEDIANELNNIREILERQSTTEKSSKVGEWKRKQTRRTTDQWELNTQRGFRYREVGTMIKEYIEAWNENKFNFELWLKHDVDANMIDYPDIVKGLIDTVINPYIEDTCDTLNASKMSVIDDGEYQGTNIFIIPYNRYQPTEEEYVITHNYYGSCAGCDALMACQGWGAEVEESTIKGIMSIALLLLERMKPLYEIEGADDE